MRQALHLEFTHDIQVLAYFLYESYSQVESSYPKGGANPADVEFKVQNSVIVKFWHKSDLLEISWESSGHNDMVADSVCLLAMQLKDQPTP